MIHTLELDLLAPAPLVAPKGRARVLVRVGPHVAGEIDLAELWPEWEDVSRRDIANAFRSTLAWHRHVRVGESATSDPRQIAIVVTTTGRPDVLDGCIHAIGELDPPPGEVVLVRSPTDATPADTGERHVRTITVDDPSRAARRNTGWRTTTAEVVAFLDDDVRPGRDFVAVLARGFAIAPVAVVTGLVLPVELATYVEQAYEARFGAGRSGFERRFLRPGDRHDPTAFVAWGSNLAVRRSTLDALGGFDGDLGPDAPIGVGNDARFVDRALHDGATLLYEPSLVVRHVHPRMREELLGEVRRRRAAETWAARSLCAELRPADLVLRSVRELAAAVSKRNRLAVQATLAAAGGRRAGLRTSRVLA